MKKYLYLLMMLVCTSFVSCGGSDDDEESGTGSNDISKIIVTGNAQKYDFVYGESSCSFSYALSGYLNLTPEMKLLPTTAFKFGIEVMKNGTFVGRYTADKLYPDNSFTILIQSLVEKATYQYVAFFQNGIVTEYGEPHTFTTPSAESELAKLTIKTGKVAKVYKNEVFITESEFRVACSKDKSKLTADNIKNAMIIGSKKSYTNNDLEPLYSYKAPNDFSFARNITVWSYYNDISVYLETDNYGINSNIFIWQLTNSTTYYYCGFKVVMGNVYMGEVKSFKTN